MSKVPDIFPKMTYKWQIGMWKMNNMTNHQRNTTKMRCHNTPVRMAIFKKSTDNSVDNEDKREPLYIVSKSLNLCIMENTT